MRSCLTRTIELPSGTFERSNRERPWILMYAITYQLTIVPTLIFFVGEFRVQVLLSLVTMAHSMYLKITTAVIADTGLQTLTSSVTMQRDNPRISAAQRAWKQITRKVSLVMIQVLIPKAQSLLLSRGVQHVTLGLLTLPQNRNQNLPNSNSIQANGAMF